MDLRKQAEKLLEKNFIRNYCILEMLRASENADIDILNESVLIRLTDQESFIMLSAVRKEDGEALLGRNLKNEDKGFYTIDEWPMITRGRKLQYRSDCVQLTLPDSVKVHEDRDGIIDLTEDMAGYIHERYDHRDVISEDYIRQRIRIGPAFGIMDCGVLAGWVITHEEGTMGALTVLPEYRRKGYANRLTSAMVTSLRALGKPCLVHIIKGNIASLTLSKNMGMVYSCDVNWLILE